MAPSLQYPWQNGEGTGKVQVVISGMSGIYAGADSVQKFSEHLYNKVDPIEKRVYESNHPELPTYYGKSSNIDNFDGQQFKVSPSVAAYLDPVSRKLLEHSFQAIYDAGYAPEHLRGKKVSVYMTTSHCDSINQLFSARIADKGLGLLGCNKAMFSNRISYLLDLKGPSVSIDAICGGGAVALDCAFNDIANGHCEAAIIGGGHIYLNQYTMIHLGRVVQFSPDGKTRSFDENANGLVKSDVVSALFLQRADSAKRVYAEVVKTATNFGGMLENENGPKFGFHRDPVKIMKFLKSFYEDADIPPETIEYVEAFGSGIPEIDKAELDVISEIYCKNRDDTLMVGSVMSNIGYSESATALPAINKVLLGYHTGLLAGTLHCERPRTDVPALRDGRMRIVTEHAHFGRKYAAVNSYSVTGINAHVLLHGRYKPKDPNRYKSSIPYLVNISARQDTFVSNIIENLKSRPIDPEEIVLLHNVHSAKIRGDLGRGFVILDTKEGITKSLSETAVHCDVSKRPLWFVYSGMGSQWAGMGAKLMRIPVFAESIERCKKVLEPKGLDIVHIISTTDNTIFDNILHSFVGIAAIQIGLTDVLSAVGIVPDKIIGHSVGEMGCAYADGCLTAEEMILAAYSRGKVSVETTFIPGAMAAVGLGYQQILPLLPPDIEVACHNSSTSSTISGPAEKVAKFTSELVSKGIFAKGVSCSNIAYHSRYISEAGPKLLNCLKDVILNPKPRSERWVSTSVPQTQWNEPIAKTSSAEYHTNNLLNPVLFEEGCRLIPDNAVVVEIAPHGLLQAILKRSLPESCVNIALTLRGHSDNALRVLEAIGTLFVEGFNPRIDALYPAVEFPVSTGTPMLSHLIEWVPTYMPLIPVGLINYKKGSSCRFLISVHEDEHKVLNYHLIKGKVHYPFSAALVAVWDTLAMSLDKPRRQMSVKFSDLRLFSQPPISKNRALNITVNLIKGADRFEVIADNNIYIATGCVSCLEDTNVETSNEDTPYKCDDDNDLTSDDIYHLLHSRDFQYKDDFRSLVRVNASLTSAQIVWKNDWVTFLDGVFQLTTLRHNYDYLSQPRFIRNLCIKTNKHASLACSYNNEQVYTANIIGGDVSCGGVSINDISYRKNLIIEEEDIILNTLNKNKEHKEEAKGSKNSALQIGAVGNLDSLEWVHVPESTGSGVEVNVHYAAINTLDVKRATGQIVHEEPLSTSSFAMDFSGLTNSSARVMGLVRRGAARSRVRALPHLLWPVPDHWTLEDAATVPTPYLIALYCLGIKCEFIPRRSVLVHGGVGAIGQAVLSIALAHGAEVFTTVSDQRKKKFLLKLFPDLKEDHVACSRDESFADMVKIKTKGKGVDIIIGSVTGYIKDLTVCCGGYSAVYLDLTQIPTCEDYNLGWNNLDKDRNYIRVDLDSVIANENIILEKLYAMMSEGIRKGYVRPLTRVTYAPHEAPRAFRLLAASNHRGRALLRLQPAHTTQPRLCCSPQRSQLVLCVDTSLGMQWADTLVARGATHLTLHCMQPPNYLRHKIQLWKSQGIVVKLSSTDLTTNLNITQFIHEINSSAPLESLYVIATDEKGFNVNNVNTILDGLVVVCKKLSLDLRHFAVLTTEKEVGVHLNPSEIQHTGPLTYLVIDGYKKIDGYGSVSPRGAMSALERALCSPEHAFTAHAQLRPHTTLIEHIARIADVRIPKDTPDDCTLMELGIQRESATAVIYFLSHLHNVYLIEDIFLKTTLKDIQDLDDYLFDADLPVMTGPARFFSQVDDDEIRGTAEAVLMATLANRNYMPLQDLNVDETYLFVVPGLEGQHGRFRALCEGLQVPAVVLQPGLDHPHETGEQLAHRLAKYLLDKLGLRSKKHYYLLGYEAGIATVLEMSAILEEHGLSGTVFLLGGGWQEVRDVIEAECAAAGGLAAMAAAAERHIGALAAGAHSRQYVLSLQRSAGAALRRALHPRAARACGRAVLLRALPRLAADTRCTAFINSYLRPEDKEAFEKRDLCELYTSSELRYL